MQSKEITQDEQICQGFNEQRQETPQGIFIGIRRFSRDVFCRCVVINQTKGSL
jgi:hypothetical protein